MNARLRVIKPAIAFNVNEAAEAVGVGETAIKNALESGALPKHYIGTRPVILATDLAAWVASLPMERAS